MSFLDSEPKLIKQANETMLEQELTQEELQHMSGGSALTELNQIKPYKTKDGAYCKLEIMLLMNHISQEEHDLLASGVRDDPYWR